MIRLDFPDDRASLFSGGEINDVLTEVGAGAWPLPLSGAPEDVRQLLARPTLSDAGAERIKSQFLLNRGRILQTLRRAGQEPNVRGGGELVTFVSNEGYSYPQLWVVEAGVDYTRFDRFHVNSSKDGVGVNEVLQLLSGDGVVVRLKAPDGTTLTLRLDCPGPDQGWLITYNGGKPHIGSLSSASPGTKLLVQAIGPPQWELIYI